MEVSGINISNKITIRLNKQEVENFKSLKMDYPYLNNSKLIKQLLFRSIKPFLNEYEKQILINYICELNAIGRNLNQLIKYKAFNDCQSVINDIKELIHEAKKVF